MKYHEIWKQLPLWYRAWSWVYWTWLIATKGKMGAWDHFTRERDVLRMKARMN